MKKTKKLLFISLSLTLIFSLILDIYPAIKATQQYSSVWGNEVFSKQYQRQQPKTPKPTNTTTNSGFISRIRFILPSKGAPGQRTYAAARTDCPAIEKPMTALIPLTNIGLTISERPTFWFYIPYQSISTNPVEFQLENDNNNIVYRIVRQLTDKPGIIRIVLPENASILEKEKKYKWALSFICDSANRIKDTVVKGYIERVSINPNLKNNLERARTPRERILLFAENGLWYDALTLLAEERLKNPNDIQLAKDWKDLLQSPNVELQGFVLEPILGS